MNEKYLQHSIIFCLCARNRIVWAVLPLLPLAKGRVSKDIIDIRASVWIKFQQFTNNILCILFDGRLILKIDHIWIISVFRQRLV